VQGRRGAVEGREHTHAARGVAREEQGLGQEHPRLGVPGKALDRLVQQREATLTLALGEVGGGHAQAAVGVAVGRAQRLVAVGVGLGAVGAMVQAGHLHEEARLVGVVGEQRSERLGRLDPAAAERGDARLGQRRGLVGGALLARATIELGGGGEAAVVLEGGGEPEGERRVAGRAGGQRTGALVGGPATPRQGVDEQRAHAPEQRVVDRGELVVLHGLVEAPLGQREVAGDVVEPRRRRGALEALVDDRAGALDVAARRPGDRQTLVEEGRVGVVDERQTQLGDGGARVPGGEVVEPAQHVAEQGRIARALGGGRRDQAVDRGLGGAWRSVGAARRDHDRGQRGDAAPEGAGRDAHFLRLAFRFLVLSPDSSPAAGAFDTVAGA